MRHVETCRKNRPEQWLQLAHPPGLFFQLTTSRKNSLQREKIEKRCSLHVSLTGALRMTHVGRNPGSGEKRLPPPPSPSLEFAARYNNYRPKKLKSGAHFWVKNQVFFW